MEIPPPPGKPARLASPRLTSHCGGHYRLRELGAYTTECPSHITFSSLNADNQRTAAFETVFDEVLHTMDRPFFERSRSAAREQGKRRALVAMHALLQRHWQPWLDGQITLDEALRRIAADL